MKSLKLNSIQKVLLAVIAIFVFGAELAVINLEGQMKKNTEAYDNVLTAYTKMKFNGKSAMIEYIKKNFDQPQVFLDTYIEGKGNEQIKESLVNQYNSLFSQIKPIPYFVTLARTSQLLAIVVGLLLFLILSTNFKQLNKKMVAPSVLPNQKLIRLEFHFTCEKNISQSKRMLSFESGEEVFVKDEALLYLDDLDSVILDVQEIDETQRKELQDKFTRLKGKTVNVYSNVEIIFNFSPEGTTKLNNLISDNLHKRLAIIIDDLLLTAVYLSSDLTSGQIKFSTFFIPSDYAEELVNKLNQAIQFKKREMSEDFIVRRLSDYITRTKN